MAAGILGALQTATVRRQRRRPPSARRSRWRRILTTTLTLLCPVLARAQLDPVPRRVFQAGYTLPIHEHGPLSGYAYYYYNEPDWQATNLTLRLAVVPVYLDAELGVRQFLGPHTDLGLGLSGGGFADSHAEIRQGDFLPKESFTGHGAEASLSVYHLFNPNAQAPLYAVVRTGARGSFFVRDDDTASTFEIPDDLAAAFLRIGLRFGGREPYLTPTLAGEFSVWYQGDYRANASPFGYAADRVTEPVTHLFWARALLAYTFEESRQYFQISLNLGTSLHADRLSAYRLGGNLELSSEFPLRLPGYHAQEISAERFVLLDASYLAPLDSGKRLFTGVFGSVATVTYLDGLEQPGSVHSGLGTGLLYRTPSGAWQFGVAYAYGIQALREDGRGAHSVSFLLQYDVDAERRAGGRPFWNPVTGARIWRGVLGALGGRR